MAMRKMAHVLYQQPLSPLPAKGWHKFIHKEQKKTGAPVRYTIFMKELVKLFPKAKRIRLVQDNLNTHNTSSFYENLLADEAFELAQKFEYYYTPKSASWLNMIEIEFSVLSKQCLNRKIPTKELLEKEILTIVKRGRPCGT